MDLCIFQTEKNFRLSKTTRMLKEERTYTYKVCASYGSSIFLKGNSEVFADDPSKKVSLPAMPIRNRENRRVEKGGKERYGEENIQEYTKEAL